MQLTDPQQSQLLDASMSFPSGVTGITYSLVESSQNVVSLSLDGYTLTAIGTGTTSVKATGMLSGSEVSITATVTVTL
jgi:hypothetical protein